MNRLISLFLFVSICLISSEALPLDIAPDPARVEQIAAWLPEKPHGVGRPIGDRQFWSNLFNAKQTKSVIAAAEKELAQPRQEESDTLYLEFSKNGNRTNYQSLRSKRCRRLATLVKAELLENRGRFIPEIEAMIESTCKQRSWVLPAHDKKLTNFNQTQYTVDLVSSKIAWDLSTIDYYLGERLKPETGQLIRDKLEERIFAPVEGTLKTGKPAHWWLTRRSNWNSVCQAGVIGAAVTILEDPRRRALYLAEVEKNIVRYLDGFSDDGYCSEGVAYWNYGFGHFLRLAEFVYQQTHGRLDLYALPKVETIACYGHDIMLTKKIAPPFSDCPVGSNPSRLYCAIVSRRFGFGWSEGEQFEAMAKSTGQSFINWGLDRFSNSIAARPATLKPESMPKVTWFSEAGILLCRPAEESQTRLAIAIKGGHNGEQHNQNDVGSFIIACDDKMPITDPGSEVYTRRTFSRRRYESAANSSFGHPVPRLAGELQQTGKKAAAKVINADFGDTIDTFEIDMTAAYKLQGLKKLTRKMQYDRTGTGKVTIADRVEFSEPESFETALVTFENWKKLDENRLQIGEGPGAISVTINTGGKQFEIEATEIKENFKTGKTPTRLAIRLVDKQKSALIQTTIVPAESK
jgi:Heparinase II/III-like protein